MEAGGIRWVAHDYPVFIFSFLGGGGEGSGGWWDLMMTPSSLDIVWGRSPLLSQNI